MRLCSDVVAWTSGWCTRLFDPAPASSPVPGLSRLAQLLCARRRRQSESARQCQLIRAERLIKRLLMESSRTSGVVPTRARSTKKFFNLDRVDFGANNKPPIPREPLPRFLPPPVVRECLHGLGKSTICAAESAPESTNTIPQFVLETEELKQRQMKQRCALKCTLVVSTGSALKYHLTLGMGTSTFCTVVRFCTRSCNFALQSPL